MNPQKGDSKTANRGTCLLRALSGGSFALLALAVLAGSVIFLTGRQRPAGPPQAGGPVATPTAPAALATVAVTAPTATLVSSTLRLALPTPTPWAENGHYLQLLPEIAVAGDVLQGIISGVSATSCVPTLASFERLDTGYLPIDLVQESGEACTAGEAPWLLTVDLGVLAPGSHIVEVYITRDGQRTRHAAQLLYINREFPQPEPTAPPGATPTAP